MTTVSEGSIVRSSEVTCMVGDERSRDDRTGRRRQSFGVVEGDVVNFGESSTDRVDGINDAVGSCP
jgi:hypothetical protein